MIADGSVVQASLDGDESANVDAESKPQERAPARLDSWKEIAAYFKRSVRCVQRWEKTEGLPVYRHTHRHGASIYAYARELETWWRRERIPAASCVNRTAENRGGSSRGGNHFLQTGSDLEGA